MYKHASSGDLEAFLAVVEGLDREGLAVLEAAVERRWEKLGGSGVGERPAGDGTVEERRAHRGGLLQLEWRKGRRGERIGPYWYFRWREGEGQKAIYLGKTDEPENVLGEKLAENR